MVPALLIYGAQDKFVTLEEEQWMQEVCEIIYCHHQYWNEFLLVSNAVSRHCWCYSQIQLVLQSDRQSSLLLSGTLDRV